MVVTLVAFLAGAVSVLTPCVLPLLPALLAVAGSGGRRRVTGLVVGIIASFSTGLVALTAVLSAAGAIGSGLRWVAVGLLGAIGAMFLLPPLKDRVEAWTSRVVSRVRPRAAEETSGGFSGGVLTGLALGVVWTPCAGPILAAVAVAAAQDDLGPRTLVTLAAFVLGMAVPLTAIALGGRAAGGWLRATVGGRRLDVATGVVLLATAGLIASGLDVRLNRWVAENTALATTITADLESSALGSDAGSAGSVPSGSAEAGGTDAEIDLSPEALEAEGYPELGVLADLGPAPAPTGLGSWINTPSGEALTADDLDGRVVLVDFWTYSCINCLRTLPHLRAWHDAYADDGLVILGVHAPEFAFESEPANVEAAVKDLDVTWPVALDNDYQTWTAFSNRYWPAKYLIDRDGTLRYVHYGEGAYEETERAIRDLLASPDADGTDRAARDAPRGDSLASSDLPAASATDGQTPETYLGYERGRRFVGFLADDPDTRLAPDEAAAYWGPDDLDRHVWTLTGEWTIEGERSVAGRDAQLWLHYYGRDVFLVVGDTRAGRAASAEPAIVVSADQGPGGQTREHVVDSQRLYVLRDTDEPVDGLMTLTVPAGVAVYAFTFG